MAGITLTQLAQVQKDPEVKFIELSLLRESRVMNYISFENVSNLKVAAQYWQKLPTGGSWRQVNAGYTSAEDGQLAEAEEYLYAFGGDITFDTVLEKIKDVARDPIQLQVEGKLRSMALQWNDKLINGDVGTEPNSFDGLKKRVAGLPTRQTVYWAASNAAPLDPTASAANARSFFNRLRTAKRYCNGGQVDAILCNEDFVLGIAAALLYLQSAGNYLTITKDQFDLEVVSYQGIPLVDMGYKEDLSTEILTTTETAGDAGADSMSQYFVAFNNKEGVHGIQLNDFTAYDPLKGAEMESKPSKLKRIDWWNGIANFGTRSMVRARNLSNLAGFTEK
jgi:hypothetical protein